MLLTLLRPELPPWSLPLLHLLLLLEVLSGDHPLRVLQPGLLGVEAMHISIRMMDTAREGKSDVVYIPGKPNHSPQNQSQGT